MPLASTEALATTMYSYIDEQGTPVITDNFNTIPERYRARVKTTEQISTAPQGTSTAGTIHERVTNWGRQLTRYGFRRRAQHFRALSFTVADSDLCGSCGDSPVVAMYMSKGQVVRLLALWCLIMLGLGTPILMYVSKDGPMDVIQNKAAQAQKQHKNRLQQIP